METAKVDIRKLQMLNDRITQTIEALNQVRISVHGIEHTPVLNPQLPYGIGPVGMFRPGFSPYLTPYYPYPVAPDLSHTAAYPATVPTQVPYLPVSQFPTAVVPFGYPQGGISHSLPETEWLRLADPHSWAMRLAQTFPYAYQPITPCF